MAIYLECPKCHRKQSMTNKTCRNCSHKVKKDRRWNKVVYWVYLRHKGLQVWKRIGESLSRAREEEARIRLRLVDEEYEKQDRKIKIEDFFVEHYLPWAKIEKGTWANIGEEIPFLMRVRCPTKIHTFQEHSANMKQQSSWRRAAPKQGRSSSSLSPPA